MGRRGRVSSLGPDSIRRKARALALATQLRPIRPSGSCSFAIVPTTRHRTSCIERTNGTSARQVPGPSSLPFRVACVNTVCSSSHRPPQIDRGSDEASEGVRALVGHRFPFFLSSALLVGRPAVRTACLTSSTFLGHALRCFYRCCTSSVPLPRPLLYLRLSRRGGPLLSNVASWVAPLDWEIRRLHPFSRPAIGPGRSDMGSALQALQVDHVG